MFFHRESSDGEKMDCLERGIFFSGPVMLVTKGYSLITRVCLGVLLQTSQNFCHTRLMLLLSIALKDMGGWPNKGIGLPSKYICLTGRGQQNSRAHLLRFALNVLFLMWGGFFGLFLFCGSFLPQLLYLK